MTNSAPSTARQERPVKKQKPQGQTDNVGRYNSCIDNSQLGRLGQRKAEFVYDIARLKAERSLYMAFGVSTRMLDCLMFLDTFLSVTGRTSMAASVVVSSSGRSRKWRSEMWSAMAQNLACGTIEKTKRGAYGFTQKGHTILKTFAGKREEIARDMVANPAKTWFSERYKRAA